MDNNIKLHSTNKINIPISAEALQSLAKCKDDEVYDFLSTWYAIDTSRIENIEAVSGKENYLIVTIKLPR